jgi:hypothetical protein
VSDEKLQPVIVTCPFEETENGTRPLLRVVLDEGLSCVEDKERVPVVTEMRVKLMDVDDGDNDDDVKLREDPDDESRGVTPLPRLIANIISIHSNSNSPSFLIHSPLPRKLFPILKHDHDGIEFPLITVFVKLY